MTKKGKTSRRNNVKYPGFNKKYNPKVNREYMEIDYLDKLTEDEKKWLHKFEEEFNGASLDFKNLKNNLHNTPELKKDCTDRKNSRNRCMYGIAKASGLVSDDTRYENDNKPLDLTLTEEALIEYIDKKKSD